MAFIGQVFDENNSKPQSYDLVPKGWYNAEIVKSEIKDSTRSDWKGLNIQYKIIGPTHGGRVIFSSITLSMPSKPNVEEIGAAQIGSLRLALGIGALQDTDQLAGKPLKIRVVVQEGKNGYDDSNSVSGWKALEGSEAPKPTEKKQDDIPDIF